MESATLVEYKSRLLLLDAFYKDMIHRGKCCFLFTEMCIHIIEMILQEAYIFLLSCVLVHRS